MKDLLTWGRWTFNSTVLTLDFDNGQYEIDLERCNSSAEVLDWICQLQSKVWTTAEDIGNLVAAFDDLLRPQANLCSFGRDTKITVTRDMLLDNARREIAYRIVKAAEPPRDPDASFMGRMVNLGELMRDYERAEEIVSAHPRMSFDSLVAAYRQASDGVAELGEAA